MLFLDSELFAAGRCSFYDDDANSREGSSKLWVEIRIGSYPFLAQLDTGAPWTMLNTELAESLELFGNSDDEISVSTRNGICVGALRRINLSLVADEGQSLEVNATVFVSRQWDGPNFIGWNGFLERIRFAVDPSVSHFYFGAS